MRFESIWIDPGYVVERLCMRKLNMKRALKLPFIRGERLGCQGSSLGRGRKGHPVIEPALESETVTGKTNSTNVVKQAEGERPIGRCLPPSHMQRPESEGAGMGAKNDWTLTLVETFGTFQATRRVWIPSGWREASMPFWLD